MRPKIALLGLGAAVIAVGATLLARFWRISGTETPPGHSGGETVTGFDWATFVASPVLILGGVALVVYGVVRRRPAPAPPA